MNPNLSATIGRYLKDNHLLLATAESCTAGLVAATIAETSGSSQWLEAGFVVYSPSAKSSSLGVSLDTIEQYNITSCEVAREMAIGALEKSRANISIGITGVAGPGGGTSDIPVGTVCMSWAFSENGKVHSYEEKVVFPGDRNTIRQSVVEHVLVHIPFYHEKSLKNKSSYKI